MCKEKTKRLLSEKLKNRVFTKEHKNNISIAHIGTKKPWATNRNKIGTKLTLIQRLNISRGNSKKTSVHYGVYFHNQSKRWRVKLYGKHYGNFITEEKALDKINKINKINT